IGRRQARIRCIHACLAFITPVLRSSNVVLRCIHVLFRWIQAVLGAIHVVLEPRDVVLGWMRALLGSIRALLACVQVVLASWDFRSRSVYGCRARVDPAACRVVAYIGSPPPGGGLSRPAIGPALQGGVKGWWVRRRAEKRMQVRPRASHHPSGR